MSLQLPLATGQRSLSYVWEKLARKMARLLWDILMFLLEAATAEADAISLMDRGDLVESGSHAELLDANASYAALWSAWAEGRDR